jgi:hypothetical protein
MEKKSCITRAQPQGIKAHKRGAHASHRAKLIPLMKMGSPWIQQQVLSKPQNVQTWGDKEIKKL